MTRCWEVVRRSDGDFSGAFSTAAATDISIVPDKKASAATGCAVGLKSAEGGRFAEGRYANALDK